MADLDENLVSVLLADSAVLAITNDVHVNRVPHNKSQPYIWFQSANKDEQLDLDGEGGAWMEGFDIECCSTDLDEAKDLQAAVRSLLNGKTGTFGDQNIAFAFVQDQDDTYESRQDFGDSELVHVSALYLELGVDGR